MTTAAADTASHAACGAAPRGACNEDSHCSRLAQIQDSRIDSHTATSQNGIFAGQSLLAYTPWGTKKRLAEWLVVGELLVRNLAPAAGVGSRPR